jgi:large subunit ribosomal protein L15
MRLHDLKPRPGAKHRRKRLGQGESSGHGKTSGRGGKGQTARSGSSIRIGFEGGQMPLIRRVPKRGFNNTRHEVRYLPVNLEYLNRFDDGARVDEAALRTAGLANGRGDGIKILGGGDLTKKLTVRAHSFSASAKTKIEAKGGTCEFLVPPRPPRVRPVFVKAPPKPEGAKSKPAKKAKSETGEKEKPKTGEPKPAKPAKKAKPEAGKPESPKA